MLFERAVKAGCTMSVAAGEGMHCSLKRRRNMLGGTRAAENDSKWVATEALRMFC